MSAYGMERRLTAGTDRQSTPTSHLIGAISAHKACFLNLRERTRSALEIEMKAKVANHRLRAAQSTRSLGTVKLPICDDCNGRRLAWRRRCEGVLEHGSEPL